jgi:adenylosuccinate synthase
MHNCDMVIDLQYGSTGKGLLAGYLAKRRHYDTVVCAFAPNAGHTYIDRGRGIHMMTQQLPTGICSPGVKNILIGPGALVDLETLEQERERYSSFLFDKRIVIHPQAVVVSKDHAIRERLDGYSKIGSTTKGVGAAMIDRIRRCPEENPTFGALKFNGKVNGIEVDANLYRDILEESDAVLVEGAQGFGLSMYHGFYPYTTSRDVTPWQIAADCGLPFKWAPYIKIYGTLRTFPIRVNNRDGFSGPVYEDQHETSFEAIEQQVELTTVTKLPRRIFTFSQRQMTEAAWHCGQYYHTNLFLNFANYMSDAQLRELIALIETPGPLCYNAPKVEFLGFGPDDANVATRETFDAIQ